MGWIYCISKEDERHIETSRDRRGASCGVGHSPDIEFYPYLWMLGGEIVKQKTGNPTKGKYWFPAFNGIEGVQALGFIKAQIDAGIKPQRQHFWGQEFLDRKFAVMLEAVQNHVHLNTTEQKQAFERNVGYFQCFPYQTQVISATLLGGFEFSIPQTSRNKIFCMGINNVNTRA